MARKRKPKTVRFPADIAAIVTRCAIECEAAELPIEAHWRGKLHQWVMANCHYRENQEFLIVQLVAKEMAGREAVRTKNAF